LVQLDPDRSQRLLATLAGLADWELARQIPNQAQIASRWNMNAAAWDQVLILPKGTELILTRRLAVSRASDVLELLAACPLDLDEHHFQLAVNNQPLAWIASADRRELSEWTRRYGSQRARDEDDGSGLSDRLAYWWDLAPWRGQEVNLTLSLAGQKESNEIAWRGLSVRSAVSNLPESGQPLGFDVPLTSLVPLDQPEAPLRGAPIKDGLPDGRNPSPIRFLGQRFSGGYGMKPNSSISFPIAPGYRKFVAVAGCASKVAGPLAALIDGRVVWERRLASNLSPAEQLELEIPAGAKTLTLQTGPGGSAYSYAAWAEAGFVTK
jgi:hypothetical protein